MNDGTPKVDGRHTGCRLFVSKSGLTGFALGTQGDRAGWLYDFFASPRDEQHVVPQLMALAVQEGARRLVTYEHPFFETFFSTFGFQTRVRARLAQLNDPPPAWIPDIVAEGSTSNTCPDFLCMLRADDGVVTARSLASDTTNFASRPGTVFREARCAGCDGELPRLQWLDVLDGYLCRGCGFLHVTGTLTLAPWDGPLARSKAERFTGSGARRPDRTTFSSGLDLLQ